jgi:hypothetical protein
MPLLFPTVSGPIDPATNKPLESCRERLDYLIEDLETRRVKIIVPTPALSEILVHADRAGVQYLNKLRQSRAFRIASFDERAAVEVAMTIRQDIEKLGRKRGRTVTATWAKVKFDRQIVAIAKVNGASIIYSGDEGIRTFAEESGIVTVALWQLPLPTDQSQMTLFKGEPDAS